MVQDTMKTNLSKPVRIMCLVAALLLIPTVFLPLWRIDLIAPQYPEGLYMLIYASKLGGNVEIINGLNHYIGMRELYADDFPEFTFLPYVLGGFALLGILVAWLNKSGWYEMYVILFLLFCVLAMVDFYRWEYDYGHNLNPQAAIIVPGMSYQPPLIGVKQLLNFTAYSFPSFGGYFMVVTALLLVTGFVLQWKKDKKNKRLI
jgi:copper chaperone NosL